MSMRYSKHDFCLGGSIRETVLRKRVGWTLFSISSFLAHSCSSFSDAIFDFIRDPPPSRRLAFGPSFRAGPLTVLFFIVFCSHVACILLWDRLAQSYSDLIQVQLAYLISGELAHSEVLTGFRFRSGLNSSREGVRSTKDV